MLECMKAYGHGLEGVLRPDHVPTMEGDSNEHAGYSSIGRLFAIGYIKGLRQAVYAEDDIGVEGHQLLLLHLLLNQS